MVAYDPEATETFKAAASDDVLSKMTFASHKKQVLKTTDALIVCTEWSEFRRPAIDHFKNSMKTPVIFDGRNLFDLDKARDADITYISVGRPAVNVEEPEPASIDH